eukprot:8373757-Lingulodinium_polyedra.AAC.1
MQCNAMQCKCNANAMQMQCSAMHCNETQRNAMQRLPKALKTVKAAPCRCFLTCRGLEDCEDCALPMFSDI